MGGRRWWIFAVLLGVPAALALTWLTRTAPPSLDCADVVIAGRERLVDDWLRGAGPIFAVAALVVLAAIARISSWRRVDRGETAGVGGPTVVVATLLTLYVVACAIETDLFAGFYVLAIAGVTLWLPSLSIVGLPTAAWLLTQPPGQRTIAVVQVLSWCSLLVGVGAIAVAVAVPVTRPLCLD